MQAVTTIGLDIAKSVFQVHGIDAEGKVIIRRELKRRYLLAFFEKMQPCLVGIEACASSHHWSRQLKALGHTVRLMPPAYVKPYVKRQKNDAADAEAICEAVTRANMRFVETKTPEQQSCLMLHRTRHLFIRQQTSVINAIRAHLAEFGIVAPVGRKGVEQLLDVVADASDQRVPEVARACSSSLHVAPWASRMAHGTGCYASTAHRSHATASLAFTKAPHDLVGQRLDQIRQHRPASGLDEGLNRHSRNDLEASKPRYLGI
jgi:transposase